MIHYLSEIVLFMKFVSSWENVPGINTMEFFKFLQLAFCYLYYRFSHMIILLTTLCYYYIIIQSIIHISIYYIIIPLLRLFLRISLNSIIAKCMFSLYYNLDNLSRESKFLKATSKSHSHPHKH